MKISNLPLQNLIDDNQQSVFKYRILNAEFGDGYSQTAPDGINNEIREITITYNNLRMAEYNTVINFLRSLKGAYKFKFAPHGEKAQYFKIVPDSLQVTVTAISRLNNSDIYRSISFTARTTQPV